MSTTFWRLRLTSVIFASHPQVPDGLSCRLSPTFHLVDAATRMQLASTGRVAACVPFKFKANQKMTLYKGPDDLDHVVI